VLRLLYRDVDRTPYLYTLRDAAANRGLEIEIVRAAGYEFGERVLRGEVEVVAENYYNLQSLRAKGQPFISVATAVTWLNESLIVAPHIERIEELRGTKFAVRGMGPSELIERLWLEDAGIKDDVEVIVAADGDVGRWGNWHLVADGTCAGCIVTNLYVDEALAAGLKRLPSEPYGFIGNVTLTTARPVMEARRDEIEQLVRAAFDATDTFKHDRDRTLAIMREEPAQLWRDEQRPYDLERAYEILRDELSEAPVPSIEGIHNTWRMTLSRSSELKQYNPLPMWDLSFAGKIIEERMASG